MEHLDQIRAKIDGLDEKIVRLIAERMAFMPAVAKYKKAHGLPLFQPEREKEILASKRQLAEEVGADPVLIEKLFVLILEYSKEIQAKS